MHRNSWSRMGVLLFAWLVVLATAPTSVLAADPPGGPAATHTGKLLTGPDLEAASQGEFFPPPTRARLGPRAIARGGEAGLLVECRRGIPGELCRGNVGLHALRPVGSGTFYVGKARFEIPTGEKKTVWVPLTYGAKVVLANKGRQSVNVFSEDLAVVHDVEVLILPARKAPTGIEPV
jgi:hypothetical protein